MLEYWKRKGHLENIIKSCLKKTLCIMRDGEFFVFFTELLTYSKKEEIFLKRTIFQRTIRRKYPTNRTAGQHINQNDNKPRNKAIFYPKPLGMC